MRDSRSVIDRQSVWDPIGYSAVLAVAYLSMLLCWDLLRNNGSLFQPIFTTVWGLGILTTGIVVHAIVQTTYRQLSSAFSALLGTAFSVALIVLGFSYIYSANGVCNVQSNSADCLYYSVAVVTALNESSGAAIDATATGNVTLYAAWQALLGIFVFLVLISQMISFMQEYKRLKRAARRPA